MVNTSRSDRPVANGQSIAITSSESDCGIAAAGVVTIVETKPITDSALAAALRECEEACPCRKTELDCTCDEGEYEGECSYRHTCDCWSIRVNGKPPEPNESIPCKWPGHAAIARLREAAEKAGYERGYCEWEGRERNRLWEAKQAEVNR